MDIVYVTEAKYMIDYLISVKFNDNTQKVIDFEKYLTQPIFTPLKDKPTFKRFKINPFTIEWENGADFAPEFLYGI
jgi:hypothetical protein